MCTTEQFMKDLEKGKVCEELFMAWCDNVGKKYIDVRDDEEYREVDIDFLMVTHRGEGFETPIDVKKGSLKDGAIVVETKSGKYGNDGWWKKSKANWFAWVMPCCNSDNYLIITLHRRWLREWLQYYNVTTRRICNGMGAFVKLNDNNKYQKDRSSIVEFVQNELGYEKQFYWYVDSNGVPVDCEDELV